MIKAIFFLSIISYWNVIGGPPPIISKITFTEEELVIDGSQLEDIKSVSIKTLENKILKDYEVDNANPEKIVGRPLGGSFEPGDKNLYLVITDSEGELFYPITLGSKTSDQAVYKITQKKKDIIPNKIVVDEKSEINFSPGDNSGRYYYTYSIYANPVGDLAIKNEDKDLFKIDQEGNLEILGSLKVKGKTLKFNNGVINTLNFENYLFPVLPNDQRGDFRVKDVVIGEDNNISGVIDFTSSGDMDVATATFHVDSSAGRVGIGNATPTYKLDVQGSTNSGIRLRQAAVSTNTSGAFFNGMVFEDPGQVKSFGIGYGAGDLFSINSFDGTYRNIFSLNNVGNGVISGSLKIGAYTLPSTDGTSGQVLSTNGAGTASWSSAGAGIGDVVGPSSSTLDNFASFSSGTGKAIKDSGINSANIPTMVAAAASSSTIILSGGADKTLTTTNYMIPSTIGSPTYVLKSDGTNAVWEQDNPGTQSLIAPTRGIATGLLPMFLTADGHVITDSDVEAINVPQMTLDPTAANQIIISTGNGKHLTTTIYPISPTIGATGTVLKSDGSGASWQPEVSVANFIAGPASSTQFALARYEDDTGKILKDSPVVMNDAGDFNFLRAVSTTEGSHPCPSMNTAERTALTVLDGDCVFDTDLKQTFFRRMDRWGDIPVKEPWVSGQQFKKWDLIKDEPFTLTALKDFTSSATITDDFFKGNLDFQSILPITTCTAGGGGVTLSGGNIDVLAGRGLIATNSTTGHPWPDLSKVVWSDDFGNTPAVANNWNTVYVDKGGVIQVISGKPTPLILRTQIVLALVNPSLSQIEDHRGPCFDSGSTIRDLNYVLGPLKKGFEYFGNANLTIGRNSGEIYAEGINFGGENQTIQSYSAQPSVQITYYMTRNSRVGGTHTNVDPNNYDIDGTLTNIPQSNRFTFQRVYLVSGGVTAIQYGQKWYASLPAAISGVTTDAGLFVENPSLAGNAKWIATIVLKDGTMALNNTTEVSILNCGIFGCREGGGGGSSGGGGDVFGPASSVANNLATFSDVTGKLIEDSGINKANLTTMTAGALGANQIIISAGGKELSSTIYQIPLAIGSTGTVLKSDGTNAFWQVDTDTTQGASDVQGPTSATDNALVRFDVTTGKLIQSSGVIVSDSDDVTGVQGFTAKGANTNTISGTTAGVTFATGRTSAGALSANQTVGDVAFEFGGVNGGYKHYISTTHTGTVGSNLNAMNFWINNGVQAASSAPGTGNNLALTLTPLGVGIGTSVPYRALDVVGDIITSVHGAASQHDPLELVPLRRIGHTSGSTLDFAGMTVTVKDVESDGTTARANNAHIGFNTWGNSIWGSKEVIRITERGRLGINTTNPPELLTVNGKAIFGGAGTTNVGVGVIELQGANGNAAGPHMLFSTNADIYPQRQFLNWAHDNIWDCFDCYYDGTNLRNSTASSSFRWYKTATDLILTTDANPTAGGVAAQTNRFWIHEDGNSHFSEGLYVNKTITAGPNGIDILGNGNLSKLVLEESRTDRSPSFTCGGAYAANPMPLPANNTGLDQANGCFAGSNGGLIYTPDIRPAGSYFYLQIRSSWYSNMATDRTDLPAPVPVPTGWIATFLSNGTTWIYQGKQTITQFNAGRAIIVSTTNPGHGTDGQVLTTDGAGSLSWQVAGSDIRLKKNVVPLTNAEKIINSLVPVKFNWNEQGLKATGQNDKRHVGLIAQDVEKILPGSIRGDKIKIINYDEVTAALVKYVQQLEKRIKILEDK